MIGYSSQRLNYECMLLPKHVAPQMVQYPEMWQALLTILVILLLIPEFRNSLWTLVAAETAPPVPDLVNPRSVKRLRSISKATMSLNAKASVYYGWPYIWQVRWVHLNGSTIAVYNKKHEYLYGFDTKGCSIDESRHENTLKLVSKRGILRIRFDTNTECSQWLRAVVYNNHYIAEKSTRETSDGVESPKPRSNSISISRNSTSVSSNSRNDRAQSISSQREGLGKTSPAKSPRKS